VDGQNERQIAAAPAARFFFCEANGFGEANDLL
jgi:hypothetical protein